MNQIPTIQVVHSDSHNRTLYRVSMPGTNKRLLFNAEELSALGDLIHRVLGGTPNDDNRRTT